MKIRTLLAAATLTFAAGAFVIAGPQGGGNKNKTGKPAQQENPASLQGKPAPTFELKTLDGQTVNLAELKGNVVLLDFWATWCPPCRESLPHVQSMAKNTELTEKGLKVIAVNAREKEDKVKPFMEQNNYSFTVAYDTDGATMQQYKVSGIPQTVVIGRDGMVKKVFVGYGGEQSAKEIDQAVEAALKAKAPGGTAKAG